MDPNEALRMLRLAIAQLEVDIREASHLIPGAVAEVREHFGNLDGWLSRGGFAPADWQKGRANRWVCGSSGELLWGDPDDRRRHANGNLCDYPELAPFGKCIDCGVDTYGDQSDPAIQGCYANRGFAHIRVVGR